MKLPNLPAEGEPITAAWGRTLVAYLNSLLPGSSPTVRVTRTPRGTTWEAVMPRTRAATAAAADEQAPWEVYASPDATGAAAWRTVRVHSGTINGLHPQSAAEDKFSDDTDYMEDGETPNQRDMDMELEAGETYYLVAVQTRLTEAAGEKNAWDPDETYIFFTTDNPAFPGHHPGSADVPDIFRNVYYRTIAKVVVGSDDEEDDDYQQLDIEQLLDANLTTDFQPPAYWEPIILTATPDDPGADDWRTAQILLPGFLSPLIEITGIADAHTLTAGATTLLWLEYTIDEDTGDVTAVALHGGAELPEHETPEPGKAPTSVYRLLGSMQVPDVVGKSSWTPAVTHQQLNYQTVTSGFDVNEDGAVVNLLAGLFWE